METRRFGRTNHNSTIIIFGTAALGKITQAEADKAVERMLAHGVNHIDIAPSYGDAELRLGPWMKRHRKDFFLGCKTQERTKQGAWNELRRSLDRLQTDHFDLYQMHSLRSIEDANAALGPGGAIEAFLEAKAQGLTRYLGITGHGFRFRQRIFTRSPNSISTPFSFRSTPSSGRMKIIAAMLNDCLRSCANAISARW